MIHYHGTPITPGWILQTLAGKHFCVRYGVHYQADQCFRLGQSVMLDNGAYSFWRKKQPVDWPGYYRWILPYLDHHTTWAVIPDVIDGTEEENDALVTDWFRQIGPPKQAAPVWHLHESLGRLAQLVLRFDRVCFGSSGEYSQIGSQRWHERVCEAFDMVCKGTGRPPAWIHMLRGMSLAGSDYPFASVDSTDIARNHNRPQNEAVRMAQAWDSLNNPARWIPKPKQQAFEPIKVDLKRLVTP